MGIHAAKTAAWLSAATGRRVACRLTLKALSICLDSNTLCTAAVQLESGVICRVESTHRHMHTRGLRALAAFAKETVQIQIRG